MDAGRGPQATYGEGRRELMARAIAAEAKRDTLESYHHYEVASAAFQIGIVLASATVITGMVVLAYLAGRARTGRTGVHGDRLLRAARRAFVLRARVYARVRRTSPPFTCRVWPVDEGRVVAGAETRRCRPDRPAPGRAESPAARRPRQMTSPCRSRPGRGPRAMAPGVRVSAGAIALTVTPWGPSSVASARVSPIMPPLLAM